MAALQLETQIRLKQIPQEPAPIMARAAPIDELSWVIGMLLTALANYSSNNSRKSLIRSNGFALRLPI
jgi:hypothetical protein